MRLLLDEHIDPVVAERLRERGYDVSAVGERAALLGAADEEQLFKVAFAERRALVTYDIADFRVRARERIIDEEHHFGVVLLDPASFPQGERYLGRLMSALEALLTAMSAEDALFDREWWPDLGRSS